MAKADAEDRTVLVVADGVEEGEKITVELAAPDDPMRCKSLVPRASRLLSNSSALVAAQSAPSAPGIASVPVKARYRISVSAWPLFPVMESPKQRVAVEIAASPTMALAPLSSPFSSPQSPKI